MEETHHRRGHTTVAAVVGRGQAKGETVAVGVDHVGLSAPTLHKTRNWFIFTYLSNALHTVNSTAVPSEVADCVPALTPLVTEIYGTRPAVALF